MVLLYSSVKILLVSSVIFGYDFNSVKCKIIQGELKTTENWVFLTRFCFLSRRGKFAYEVEYPNGYKTQRILLYYDEKDHWPSVYGTNKTCLQKEAVLAMDRGQLIYLNETESNSGCEIQNVGEDDTWLRCVHRRGFLSARERWWFIAISNCKSEKGLYLRYRFTMQNHNTDPWFMHFSADEFYILQTDIGFLVLYVALFFGTLVEANALRSRHLLHRTYLLFITSVLNECVGLAFLCANYALYAQQGSVSPGIRLAGKGMEALSTLLLLTLLILIAKGYTVTRGRLRRMTVIKIAAFLAIYVIVYSSLFLYEQKFFDPGRVLYLYESPAGYGLIGLRLIGWSWFVYATIFTMIHYPEKSNFYTKLFLLYSLWFLSTPVVILISTFIVPKWMREKLVNGVELFISLNAHVIFFILTRPSKANKNFPYHVRTTQIDIMHQDATNEGANAIDRFAHHPYAVTTTHHAPSAPDYTTLFGVQNTANSTEMVDIMHQDDRSANYPHAVTNTIHAPSAPDCATLFGVQNTANSTEMVGIMHQDATNTDVKTIDRSDHHPHAVTNTIHAPSAQDCATLFVVQNTANSTEMVDIMHQDATNTDVKTIHRSADYPHEVTNTIHVPSAPDCATLFGVQNTANSTEMVDIMHQDATNTDVKTIHRSADYPHEVTNTIHVPSAPDCATLFGVQNTANSTEMVDIMHQDATNTDVKTIHRSADYPHEVTNTIHVPSAPDCATLFGVQNTANSTEMVDIMHQDATDTDLKTIHRYAGSPHAVTNTIHAPSAPDYATLFGVQNTANSTEMVDIMHQDATNTDVKTIDRSDHHPHAVTNTIHAPSAPDYATLFSVQNTANSTEMKTEGVPRPLQQGNPVEAESRGQ